MSLEIKDIFINWNFDCFFLSTSVPRTDFEIPFYLKVFPWFELNLWPSEDTWGLIFPWHSKSHILSIDTFSYRFWDIWIKISRSDLGLRPVEVTCHSKDHFLSNFYWHFRSNSYRFCDNSGQTIDGRIKWSFQSGSHPQILLFISRRGSYSRWLTYRASQSF